MHYQAKRTVVMVGMAVALCTPGAALAAGPTLAPLARTDRGTSGFPESSRRVCYGDYAFCSAATCTPTGKQIAVNTATGHALFPAAQCTCPILHGVDEVEVEGGNMKGSCRPSSPETVWSGFWFHLATPQALSDWEDAPAPGFVCGSDLRLGNKTVNCYSFECKRAGIMNGVEVATCVCPIGETFDGTRVAPNTAFFTQAGECDASVCAQYPVSDPLGFDVTKGGECIPFR